MDCLNRKRLELQPVHQKRLCLHIFRFRFHAEAKMQISPNFRSWDSQYLKSANSQFKTMAIHAFNRPRFIPAGNLQLPKLANFENHIAVIFSTAFLISPITKPLHHFIVTNHIKCQQISCTVISCPLQSNVCDYTSEQTTRGSNVMTETTEEAYIGIEEAAEYLGIKPITLRS